MKPAVVIGNVTDHGGVISTGDSTYLIDGKAVHVEGMTHFCPKCKVTVTALSCSLLVVINGRAIIVAGDKASCGATFLPSQSLWVINQLLKISRLIAKLGRVIHLKWKVAMYLNHSAICNLTVPL
ncbi:hypothetical protein GHT89_14830 [Acinetobacter baumannii]